MLNHQLLAIARGQGQHHQVSAGYLQRLPGHQGEHLIGIRPGQQPLGYLPAGAKPPLLPPRLAIKPGIPDRDARRGAERDQDRLILIVELGAALLLGEVEIAEDLVADPHRYAQERLHRRVPSGKAERPRVRGHIGQPQRPRVGDQLAEQAAALRPVMDRCDLLLVQANRDELGHLAAFSDDPERPVPGIDEGDCGLDDLPQDDLQFEVAADRHDGLQQRAHAIARLNRSCQPDLQLGQQVIKA